MLNRCISASQSYVRMLGVKLSPPNGIKNPLDFMIWGTRAYDHNTTNISSTLAETTFFLHFPPFSSFSSSLKINRYDPSKLDMCAKHVTLQHTRFMTTSNYDILVWDSPALRSINTHMQLSHFEKRCCVLFGSGKTLAWTARSDAYKC